MNAVLLIGRILFVLVFLASGLMSHLVQARQTAAYASSMGAPAASVMVPLSGLVIVAGSLMVALGVWADLGALLLGAFSLSVAFFMHPFWNEKDPAQQQNQMAHFMKNLALLGGALVLFYLCNRLQGSMPLTIAHPLFHRG